MSAPPVGGSSVAGDSWPAIECPAVARVAATIACTASEGASWLGTVVVMKMQLLWTVRVSDFQQAPSSSARPLQVVLTPEALGQ